MRCEYMLTNCVHPNHELCRSRGNFSYDILRRD